MSVVSHGSVSSTLGPQIDIIEDISITDNELLPGLAIDSKLEPKVKRLIISRIPYRGIEVHDSELNAGNGISRTWWRKYGAD